MKNRNTVFSQELLDCWLALKSTGALNSLDYHSYVKAMEDMAEATEERDWYEAHQELRDMGQTNYLFALQNIQKAMCQVWAGIP